ncbi:MAG: HAMP domain-containing sensor histidine kinase [Desulfobacterales bacterium]|nr:HAMP domain-containing sensor histidine kinase [Desulfobacterales bacterium]
MKFRHSLRTRIVISYCIFGAVLGTVFAAIVYISLDFIDDNLVDHRISREAEFLVQSLNFDGSLPAPASDHIQAYLGTNSMAPWIRQMVQGLGEGFHEKYRHDVEYHVLVKTLASYKQPLYVIYDVSALEFTESRKLMIGTILLTSIFLVVALGLWIGLVTSRKIIAPVSYLAQQVNQSQPENLPKNLSQEFYNDEIGVLAHALEMSMKRVDSFVKREQQFTRDASHELRTPVTVIKGAVELLKQRLGEEESVKKPLSRIERAVRDMENIITTFLWLAREEAALAPDQATAVLPVLKEAIEQNQHLFSQKPIEIEFIVRAAPVLNVSAPALKVVVINLVQNAFQYTAAGNITVEVDTDRVTVADTGKGIEDSQLASVKQPHFRGDESPGFGLGLAIVSRLCKRFGWQFDIDSELGKGTRVSLVFSSGEK